MSYMRTGLGLSLSDISTAVKGAGTAVKPISSSAAGTLNTASGIVSGITGIVQSFTGGGQPAAPAQTQFGPKPAGGMSTTTKVAIGVGAAGLGFILIKALRKK
jgi:hypothetical protein